ncbi:UNVERIFIED_CONTAM: hypothetical protein K2H54_043068 [Gekko kuhli]
MCKQYTARQTNGLIHKQFPYSWPVKARVSIGKLNLGTMTGRSCWNIWSQPHQDQLDRARNNTAKEEKKPKEQGTDRASFSPYSVYP